MVYNVIGLMSGSSLDGLDIALVELTEIRGAWTYVFTATECVPYEGDFAGKLARASALPVPQFLRLHTEYGHWLGARVLDFIEKHGLDHKVHFLASHGHTVFHDPATKTTTQIGDGAAIAAVVGLPVISDLRNVDVALGGQGAPIVPIGDQLLFGQYPYLLNLGGIANLTVQNADSAMAFDVCAANAPLNRLARRQGNDFDADGAGARRGTVNASILGRLNAAPYLRQSAPKSLSNEATLTMAEPALSADAATDDLLATMCEHIAEQVTEAAIRWGAGPGEMLVTGGGALNGYLIERLEAKLESAGIVPVVPPAELVQFKEALVMALMGALRWREEINVLASVTGAARDSVGGALWLG
jgi:anhydro-N-acetylmuramic acid kinase